MLKGLSSKFSFSIRLMNWLITDCYDWIASWFLESSLEESRLLFKKREHGKGNVCLATLLMQHATLLIYAEYRAITWW